MHDNMPKLRDHVRVDIGLTTGTEDLADLPVTSWFYQDGEPAFEITFAWDQNGDSPYGVSGAIRCTVTPMHLSGDPTSPVIIVSKP